MPPSVEPGVTTRPGKPLLPLWYGRLPMVPLMPAPLRRMKSVYLPDTVARKAPR